MRASTDGCTEWSCMYHGGSNRFKSGHAQTCPVFQYDGFLLPDFDGSEQRPADFPQCDCEARRAS